MAITAAQAQAELGTSPMNARILRSSETQTFTSPVSLNGSFEVGVEDGTYQYWYVAGNADAPGRTRWVRTTASDNAATQAAAILTGLRAT